MKTIFSLLILVLFSLYIVANSNELDIESTPLTEKDYQDQFRQWMVENGKSYTNEEFIKRFKNFKDNLIYINRFNAESKRDCGCDHHEDPVKKAEAEEARLEMGVNKFSDLTLDEFKDLILSSVDPNDAPHDDSDENDCGCNKDDKHGADHTSGGILSIGGRKILSTNEVEEVENIEEVEAIEAQMPASVDWSSHTVVRDQGTCASCFAFAVVGVLEAKLSIKFDRKADLSEQNLLDCTKGATCKGGFPLNCFKYIKNRGINSEATYPYTDEQGECQFNSNKVAAKIKDFKLIPNGKEFQITQSLRFAPVSISFDCNAPQFMNYKKGIIKTTECSKTKTNHAVVLVGYGTTNGVKYFKGKNSWGTGWGEKGFFRIQRGVNMCVSFLKDNIDIICFSLVCKRWYNDRDKYLIFNTDNINIFSVNTNDINQNHNHFKLPSYNNIFMKSIQSKIDFTLVIGYNKYHIYDYQYGKYR
ncbi:hypothetical protein PPL_10834 [Heterostelium album PN500]|uniref:Uncharacterized protein n=1 Tax=Heterostelium pallidum (strain ATCC 26659 / Pp 5 / PN500) TaxID=670386 RepID=D3BS42_HETP5|nr:hypothetical protein PPL_10834 [Heterostelium album PN500]EFA75779.1 hypothetical protein PPL_10834 [Heterostelium album PN500]|eukprot:XP_020427913.1 hypothetical protein PPL_10834 [Heterostelium album PN500]